MIEKILIELLAQSDAIFEPIRDWQNTKRVLACLELRDDFHRFGLPLPKLGLDFGERKRVEQLRDRLEKLGAVIFHRTLGRRTHWKLVDKTDWRLRGIATGYGFRDCLTAMLLLQALTDAGCVNGRYVGDWHIAGVTASDKTADRIHTVASVLVPAMVRGWVSNWSDGDGRTGYRLTSAGREFLDQPLKQPVEAPFEAAMGNLYLASFDSAFKNLATLKPRHESAIPIPLSAGDWPGPADGIPSLFTSTGEVRRAGDMVRAIIESMKAAK